VGQKTRANDLLFPAMTQRLIVCGKPNRLGKAVWVSALLGSGPEAPLLEAGACAASKTAATVKSGSGACWAQ